MALGIQGILVERGSSSRNSEACGRWCASSNPGAMPLSRSTGPGGPVLGRTRRKLGRRAQLGLLVPMGSAAPHGVTLERAWDRFRIPLPFARRGLARRSDRARHRAENLGLGIARASAEAHAMLGSAGHAVLRHVRRA